MEAALLQPLGEQTEARPIPENDLDEVGLPTVEQKEVPIGSQVRALVRPPSSLRKTANWMPDCK
jgi:hypothetical protein